MESSPKKAKSKIKVRGKEVWIVAELSRGKNLQTVNVLECKDKEEAQRLAGILDKAVARVDVFLSSPGKEEENTEVCLDCGVAYTTAPIIREEHSDTTLCPFCSFVLTRVYKSRLQQTEILLQDRPGEGEKEQC